MFPGLYCVGLADVVWIDMLDGDQIRTSKGSAVRECEWMIRDASSNRFPYVDDGKMFASILYRFDGLLIKMTTSSP